MRWGSRSALITSVAMVLAVLDVATPQEAAGQAFTDINAGLMGLSDGAIAWGDYDNDGDLDLVVVGGYAAGGWLPASRLYRNDGGGVFTDVHAPLVEHWYNSAAWGDYDNDGDLDLCVGGHIY